MRIDSAGNLKFNSGYGSVATAYGCRAWVNFNGTGTVAIRASGNVSSVADGGVGIYTVNFTNSMPDNDYSTQATPGVGGRYLVTANVLASGSVGLRVVQSSTGSGLDNEEMQVAVFR